MSVTLLICQLTFIMKFVNRFHFLIYRSSLVSIFFNVAGVDFESLNVQREVTRSFPQTCVNVIIIHNGIETGNTPRRFSVILQSVSTTGQVIVRAGSQLFISIVDTDGKQMAGSYLVVVFYVHK